jgi:hypothetical protein
MILKFHFRCHRPISVTLSLNSLLISTTMTNTRFASWRCHATFSGTDNTALCRPHSQTEQDWECALYGAHKLQRCSLLHIQCRHFLAPTKIYFINDGDNFRAHNLIIHAQMIEGMASLLCHLTTSASVIVILKYRTLLTSVNLVYQIQKLVRMISY